MILASFTDSTGRRWNARLSLGALRALEEWAGFPVLAALADGRELREKILVRAGVVAKALYLSVAEEAERRKVSEAEFERLVAGPALGEACRAFFEALIECFPGTAEPPIGVKPLPDRLSESEIRARWSQWEAEHES